MVISYATLAVFFLLSFTLLAIMMIAKNCRKQMNYVRK